MNQTEQMLEPCPSCRNADIYACTCPFKTERNSQPECFEPSKLVRLTDVEIMAVCNSREDFTDEGGRVVKVYSFARAIMDAMEAKAALDAVRRSDG